MLEVSHIVIAISAVGTLLIAWFNWRLWRLEHQRLNPKPTIIQADAFIFPEPCLADLPAGQPVLHVNLHIHNPGDNPIYPRELKVLRWAEQERLAETEKSVEFHPTLSTHVKQISKKGLRRFVVIAPRQSQIIMTEYQMKTLPDQEGGPLKLRLLYSAGRNHNGKLKIFIPHTPVCG